jgi:signal transduction histidine kinase
MEQNSTPDHPPAFGPTTATDGIGRWIFKRHLSKKNTLQSGVSYPFLLYKYSVVLFLTNVFFAAIYGFYLGSKKIALFSLVSGIFTLFSPLVLKFTRSKSAAHTYLLISSFSVALYTAIYTGGTRSPVLFWITAVPLGGAFLGRKPWSSLRWLLLSYLFLLIVWGRERWFGEIENELQNSTFFIQYFALFGISAVNVVVSHLFESERSRENLRILAQKKELESALSKLKQAQANLIQAEKLASLGTLAAGLAHELNNSLNFVSGVIGPMEKYLGRIPDCEDKNKILTLFDPLKRGVSISVGIINNLKNYSVQERGQMTEMNVSLIVENILAVLKHTLGPNITLKTEIQKDLNVYVSHAGMNQLMTNLLVNARDAIADQAGTITITGSAVDEKTWTLKVTDTGSGIEQRHLDKIFDPFFTTKEVGKGTGIGLFIVMREVTTHRGEVRVESTPGTGTEFSFTFPRDAR